MNLECYLKAGKIASEVREAARRKYHVGSTLYDICESVEAQIKGMGAQPAFPVNASLNEIAAHYTAEPGDQTTVKEGDVLKIDIGVHIDGYIAEHFGIRWSFGICIPLIVVSLIFAGALGKKPLRHEVD